MGKGRRSTFLLNVKGGAGARFGRHEPAKMGTRTCKNFRYGRIRVLVNFCYGVLDGLG